MLSKYTKCEHIFDLLVTLSQLKVLRKPAASESCTEVTQLIQGSLNVSVAYYYLDN